MKKEDLLGKFILNNERIVCSGTIKKYKKSFPELFLELENMTPFMSKNADYKERLFCLFNSVVPKSCEECDGPSKFRGFRKGYYRFCSRKCSDKNVQYKKEKSEKKKKTSLKNFGVEFPNRHSSIKEKIKSTNIEKYGGVSPFHSEIVKEKTIRNNLEKYGVEWTLQLPRKKINNYPKTLGNKEWLYQKHIKEKLTLLEIGEIVKCKGETVRNYLNYHDIPFQNNKSNISRYEKELTNFLKNKNIEIVPSDRLCVHPMELDILIPDYNLAIEVNGVYWHSFFQKETKEQKEKHLKKTLLCQQKNIHLIQFDEEELLTKGKVCYSILENFLNLNQKIYARKCQIEIVDKKEEKQFLEQNHLQGYVPSKICYGLYHNNELVCLMSFCKSRYNKNFDWELLRFCNKLNTNVIGGASRIFRNFLEIHNPSSIISYCDRSKFTGNLYQKLGFEFSHNTKPNYFYTKYYSKYSRLKFQKHKLKNILENFDPNLSEAENMFNHGYGRYWDCGQSVWIFSEI